MGYRLYSRFREEQPENPCGVPAVITGYLIVSSLNNENVKPDCSHGATYEITVNPPWQHMHFSFLYDGEDSTYVGFLLRIEWGCIPLIDPRFILLAKEQLEQSPVFSILGERNQLFIHETLDELESDFNSICLGLNEGDKEERETI